MIHHISPLDLVHLCTFARLTCSVVLLVIVLRFASLPEKQSVFSSMATDVYYGASNWDGIALDTKMLMNVGFKRFNFCILNIHSKFIIVHLTPVPKLLN